MQVSKPFPKMMNQDLEETPIRKIVNATEKCSYQIQIICIKRPSSVSIQTIEYQRIYESNDLLPFCMYTISHQTNSTCSDISLYDSYP